MLQSKGQRTRPLTRPRYVGCAWGRPHLVVLADKEVLLVVATQGLWSAAAVSLWRLGSVGASQGGSGAAAGALCAGTAASSEGRQHAARAVGAL